MKTIILILMLSSYRVSGQIAKSHKPNPARDPDFDVAKGIGRNGEDCKRRLSLKDDERVRQLQNELTGKKTARIGSPCNYGEWKSIRETFVHDEWIGNRQNFIRHLDDQIKKIKNEELTFEDLCIACEDEPLLECYPNPKNPSESGTCNCWRKYTRSNSTEVYEDDSEVPVCELDKGHKCRPASEVRCRRGYYCDTDTLTCICAEVQAEDCSKDSGGSIPSVPASSFQLRFCLVIFAILTSNIVISY